MAEEISSTGIDAEGVGSADFRPHLPLPYASVRLEVEKATATASYDTATLTLQAGESNWLAGHDLFPYWILFEVQANDESIFMSKHFEGFDLNMYRVAGSYLLTKTLTSLEKPPLLWRTAPTVDWLWRKRFNLLGTRVLASQTLTIDVKNCTLISVDLINVQIHAVLAKAT